MNCGCAVRTVLVGQLAGKGLGDAEIDDFGRRQTVTRGDQDVVRFDVAMDHTLLVSVLNRFADSDEKRESGFDGQLLLVAVLSDRGSHHHFHHEIGTTGRRRARIQDFGDAGMVHERQGLTLRGKAGDHLIGVHARLDDLQGDPALDRSILFRQIHDPITPTTDFANEAIPSNDIAGLFGRTGRDRWRTHGRGFPPHVGNGCSVSGRGSVLRRFQQAQLHQAVGAQETQSVGGDRAPAVAACVRRAHGHLQKTQFPGELTDHGPQELTRLIRCRISSSISSSDETVSATRARSKTPNRCRSR